MENPSANQYEIAEELQEINEKALHIIDTTYGPGPELADTKLAYHNGLHTRNVMADFARLAGVVGLKGIDFEIGLVAAGAHDLVQGTGRQSDEAASAAWLGEQLAAHPEYGEAHLAMARLAILGTEPIFEGPLMVDQQVSHLDYPSKQHELVAKVVASADLGRLYSLDGPLLAHLLYKEINKGQEPKPLTAILDFQKGQIPFLEAYRYPLPEAAKVFMADKALVMEYIESLIGAIETGAITNWQQLLESDRKFALKGQSLK